MMKRGRDQQEMVSKSALYASAQVLSFMSSRLGYGDKEILDAAQKWGKRNQRKKNKEVTQIDMIEGVEKIIEKERKPKRVMLS